MSGGKEIGVVCVIEETKTYGQKGFRKRVVVLEQEGDKFTNYVPLEFVGDNCDAADDLSVGDKIEASFYVNGRVWQKDANSEAKYFVNLTCHHFKVLGGSNGRSDSKANAGGAANEDDIPF